MSKWECERPDVNKTALDGARSSSAVGHEACPLPAEAGVSTVGRSRQGQQLVAHMLSRTLALWRHVPNAKS